LNPATTLLVAAALPLGASSCSWGRHLHPQTHFPLVTAAAASSSSSLLQPSAVVVHPSVVEPPVATISSWRRVLSSAPPRFVAVAARLCPRRICRSRIRPPHRRPVSALPPSIHRRSIVRPPVAVSSASRRRPPLQRGLQLVAARVGEAGAEETGERMVLLFSSVHSAVLRPLVSSVHMHLSPPEIVIFYVCLLLSAATSIHLLLVLAACCCLSIVYCHISSVHPSPIVASPSSKAMQSTISMSINQSLCLVS